MLSREDNRLVTAVGPTTPIGNLMRRYWVPALMSTELPGPDCDPVRVMLLGEKLIAFRDTTGRIGLLRHLCPHRGAPLFYGRNEENGLRCVYHGWKFDAAGKCIDMPNEPPESDFKQKISPRGYPTVERGGIVWAYMGPDPDNPPQLPDLEVFDYEAHELKVIPSMLECNWLQALEGDIDTVHAGFLHVGHGRPEDAQDGTFMRFTLDERPVRYKLVDTESGVLSGAYRPLKNTDNFYWRIAGFAFPFYTFTPTGVLGHKIEALISVPMDDYHVMRYVVSARRDKGIREGQKLGLFPADPRYLPNTTDWFGRWRRGDNPTNDFNINRDRQRNGDSFTGIPNFISEDAAMVQGMGPILDRSDEHLGTTDLMIIRVRRRLLRAARDLESSGQIPPGVNRPSEYRHQRSGGVILHKDDDWVHATERLRRGEVDARDLDPSISGGI